MHLIVAEKPSVARDIAAVLGTPKKHEGYLSVGPWVITWGFGHLVTLADPEHYDPAWKAWRWDHIPMMPDSFKLIPIEKSRAQWKIVKKWLLDDEITDIVMATDPDREGEAIGRNLLALSGTTKPVQRLWLAENTKAAIQQAFKTMKPSSAYDDLAAAAEARAQADWLVGLNGTRAFTLRHSQPGQGVLSVGRVQTPTLALIVTRDRAIASFTPVPYWQVDVTFAAPPGSYVGRWTGTAKDTPDRLDTPEDAQRISDAVSPGTPGTILSVDRKRKKVQPPLPFSLNELQKLCHRKLGLSAQHTLDVAQKLYERHWTSYPRTDTPYLTQTVADTIPGRLHGLPAEFQPLVRNLPTPLASKRLVNEAKVAAAGHHAIIPTGETGSALSGTDRDVYDLIVRRLIASLMPAGEDELTTVSTAAGGHRFLTKGTAMISPGWRTALEPAPEGDEEKMNEDEDAPTSIPAGLAADMDVSVETPKVAEKKTKAPPTLNDASLLALMEKHGLGTPATRARIVEVLLARDYVTRQKKTLVSTEKGQALLRVVPEALQSPELTGGWESQLEAIIQGEGDPSTFLNGIRQYTREVVEAARRQESQIVATASSLGSCPLCKTGQIIPGKKAWGCSQWKSGCSFVLWKTVAGKKLSESQVKTLLAGKTTAELKGFTSRSGKKFSARLKLEADKVVFVFAPHAKKTSTASSRAAD